MKLCATEVAEAKLVSPGVRDAEAVGTAAEHHGERGHAGGERSRYRHGRGAVDVEAYRLAVGAVVLPGVWAERGGQCHLLAEGDGGGIGGQGDGGGRGLRGQGGGGRGAGGEAGVARVAGFDVVRAAAVGRDAGYGRRCRRCQAGQQDRYAVAGMACCIG